jgi:hypothetical protein
MQKLEGVATHMNKIFDNITFLFPKNTSVEELQNISSIQPFSDESVAFLNSLSRELSKNPQIRNYPDVATFAFFCRKGNILQIKKQYEDKDTLRLGRGIIFHIAPSNVPVNFAYSLLFGFLTGNVNIVRVPSKDFEQVEIICNAILSLSKKTKFQSCTNRINLVRYARTSSATKLFSSICDARIIWGGDEAIAQIRKNSIPARAFDVTFADRYSFCIINANHYITEQEVEKIALGFYNDTYLFDQNACTSPHLVVWLGTKENVKAAKTIFWDKLYDVLQEKHIQIQPVIAVDKLTALYNQAIHSDGVCQMKPLDNLLWRIQLDTLPHQIDEYRCSSGYFSEYHASSLSELSSIVNRKYQTLAYYGFDKKELTNFITRSKISGIDRIVPIGRTSDFSPIWDGYNLISTLTRICEII